MDLEMDKMKQEKVMYIEQIKLVQRTQVVGRWVARRFSQNATRERERES